MYKEREIFEKALVIAKAWKKVDQEDSDLFQYLPGEVYEALDELVDLVEENF